MTAETEAHQLLYCRPMRKGAGVKCLRQIYGLRSRSMKKVKISARLLQSIGLSTAGGLLFTGPLCMHVDL